MFACKHVLFFVTQIYSLLFCHADFADDADLSCYCGCRLYVPTTTSRILWLYYFVPYFSIKRLFFCKDSHIFRLRRYFCGVLGITSPIICGICGICVTYSLSHRFHRFTQILGLIKCVAPNFFCNFSPKSLAGLKIKP